MQDIFNKIACLQAEPLGKHTTFRIGGPADYFFVPKNIEEIKCIIEYCKSNSIRHMILGNGSNVLFADKGYNGVIIQIYNNMSEIRVENNMIYAQAGALLSKIAAVARDNELTGFEFAAGIPGTLGGAVVMNAGAYGGEMRDVIVSVDILMNDGMVRTFDCSEMDFGYRHSIVNDEMVVLGATIKLESGVKEDIQKEMDRLKEARVSKQPLDYPSAGSTFKRPEGYFAGKLIQDSGLKGYTVGGAMISEKHSGFVINYCNATADDVVKLIGDVSDIVEERFGVRLEPEVRIIR